MAGRIIETREMNDAHGITFVSTYSKTEEKNRSQDKNILQNGPMLKLTPAEVTFPCHRASIQVAREHLFPSRDGHLCQETLQGFIPERFPKSL